VRMEDSNLKQVVDSPAQEANSPVESWSRVE
jgi:hypothetical protein